jgi:hypothetical protein
LNIFKHFEVKRKLEVFSSIEIFFEFHSSDTEEKKDEERAENSNFLAS